MRQETKMPQNPASIIIPFGKHKGANVAELLEKDPKYAEWLLAQGWLAERFAELHSAILARGTAPDDTPEHNTIQGRFLDPLFRLAFLLAALGPENIDRRRERTRKNLAESRAETLGWNETTRSLVWKRSVLKSQLAQTKPPAYWCDTPERIAKWTVEHQQSIEELRAQEANLLAKLADIRNQIATIQVPPVVSKVAFEMRGIDVLLTWGFGEMRQSYYGAQGNIPVEIKPSLGEDYPTVMRQMARLGASYLLLDTYTGRALSLDTVRDMFKANDLTIVLLPEVEAEIPNARTLLAP